MDKNDFREKQYLVEKGGERQYVLEAELPALTKDGWVVLGKLIPVGAEVPQTHAAAPSPRPKGKGKGKGKGKDETEK